MNRKFLFSSAMALVLLGGCEPGDQTDPTEGSTLAPGAESAALQGTEPGGELVNAEPIDQEAGRRAGSVGEGQTTCQVAFRVWVAAAIPAGDSIYITGNDPALGSWNPRGLRLSQQATGEYEAIARLNGGSKIEFKVTRGSWETVEKDKDNKEISNRVFEATADRTIEIRVENWRDQANGQPAALVRHPTERVRELLKELEQTDSFLASVAGGKLVSQLLAQGQLLSPAQAKGIEEKLQDNPEDLPSRVALMGYYQKLEGRHPSSEGPYAQLILGLIKHHPRSQLASRTGYLLLPREGNMGDEKAWVAGGKLWLEHVKAYSTDPVIAGNAGIYHYTDIFRAEAQDQAIALLQQAHELDPQNGQWVWFLGDIYSSKSSAFETTADQRQAFAKQSLEYLEESMRLSDRQASAVQKSSELAAMAHAAGEFEKARSYAKERLQAATPQSESWNYGNVIHNMNVILGRIALQEGKLDEAKHYLLEAGKSPGSPQLNSFGPQFTFARELLEQGEKAVVIEYLDSVGKFWADPEARDPSNQNSVRVAQEHAQLLAKWKKEILEGTIPQDRKWR
ncbi:MAG: hypothetical protein KDA57_02830 [Planctomycetales bacterium]|nr:hypothetical protein [Planctomycetales bacterium]